MTKRLEAELLVIIKRLLNLSHRARDLERERERNIYVTYLKSLSVSKEDLRKYGDKITILHAAAFKICPVV